MSGKKWLATAVVVAMLGGYGALDAYDVAPGVLTLDRGNEPRTVKMAGHTYDPVDQPASAPDLPPAAHGAAPSGASVKASVEASLKNSWFGKPTTVTVVDADTGASLYERDSAKATTPASVTKLLTAFAITHSKLPETERLRTRAVLNGPTLDLVAGGDMVLSEGRGDATKIIGRAGLEDLANEAAAGLKAAGRTTVTVNSNSSYAPGPDTAEGWDEDLLHLGYTERITALGLASDRADNKSPAEGNPTKAATDAFVGALKKRGITATYGKDVTVPVRGREMGSIESAPVLDILGVALQDSDNAMIESLARQAAAREGVHGDSARVGQWVVAKAKAQGLDMTGVHLADTCGLAEGTTLPVRVLGQILARGTSGKDAEYQAALSRLPVAGWNGTLAERFMHPDAVGGRGLVHAKTGSLNAVASLAGDVVTASNHRLVFAVTTNGTFSQGPDGAKAALDHLVADLAKLR